MPSDGPVIRASIFDGLAGFLAAHRSPVHLPEVLEEVGLDGKYAMPQPVDEPADYLPLNQVSHAYERLAVRTQRPCLGLEFAEVYPIGAFGFLLSHAPSVREALANLEKFVHGFTRPVTLHFHEAEGGTGYIEWMFPLEFTKAMPQFVSFTLGAVIVRLRQVVGADWLPLKVELIHRPLPCPDIYRRLLGPNVRFDAPKNRLWFDPTSLARKRAPDQRHASDPANRGVGPGAADYSSLYRAVLADRARELAEATQQALASVNVRVRLRRHIEAVLSQGTPELEAVARALQLEPRTLQSMLVRVGTSYSDELSEVRKLVAERLLVSTSMSMSEIAAAIGFSELSSFTRVSREQWFGMSPRKFRDRMLTERSGEALPDAASPRPETIDNDDDG